MFFLTNNSHLPDINAALLMSACEALPFFALLFLDFFSSGCVECFPFLSSSLFRFFLPSTDAALVSRPPGPVEAVDPGLRLGAIVADGAIIGLILIDVTAGYSGSCTGTFVLPVTLLLLLLLPLQVVEVNVVECRLSLRGGEVIVRVSQVVGLVFNFIFRTVGGLPATVDADAVVGEITSEGTTCPLERLL